MEIFHVKPYTAQTDDIHVCAPASKSILNRALIMSALSDGTVKLICGSYAEDTHVLLDCLFQLGIEVKPHKDGITVRGCGGNIPNKNAALYVGSAGTAARFLAVALAFCGGKYAFSSSAQMQKRPMDILKLLEDLGVRFEFTGEPYKFPFSMYSEAIAKNAVTVDTDTSTQYASGILLTAPSIVKPFTITLTGSRISGSYISMTLDLLKEFGVKWIRHESEITVFPGISAPEKYDIETDVSGACYFYALSLLLGKRVTVKGVKRESKQGDIKFFDLLEERGVRFTQTKEGLHADGTHIARFSGFNVNMRDFSDQALTVAVLAAFADSPSCISGIGHIRYQECDRINAICENLTALGIPARWDGERLFITPAPVRGGTVKTFEDHRVAMAFTLAGLKTGNVRIENPSCTKKTFANYFDIITELTG